MLLLGGDGGGNGGDGVEGVDGGRVCTDEGSDDDDAGLQLALASNPVPLLVRRVVATLVRTPPLLVCAYDDGRGLVLSARSIIYVNAPLTLDTSRPVTVDGESLQETDVEKPPVKVRIFSA